ncbi:MAG: hypothetical protein HUU35_08150, partial [Armatimonadetes bacterium]|nr:hypothetical protein [Armatimonadota bacterium]
MAFRLSVSALLLVCLGPLRASDEDARQRLRAAAQAQSEGRLPSAWTQWQLAHEVAFSNYLNIEALARMSAVSAKGSREAATTSALLLAYFHATPPRWLSEATRNHLGELIAERIASGVAPDLPPDQSVRGVVFQGVPTGLGFEGTRYFWMNHLPSIPPPAGSQVINGVPIQLGDDDRLPDTRLPAGDGWAVVEPRHSGREMPESVKQAWRFDRCLVGYSFEPIVRFTNELGREITVPIEPWYPDQQAVWQLRFRLFYPSTVMCGKDYRAVAENLMDALLRAHWLGVEALGREAWNSTWHDEVVDIWLTPNAAEDALHAGGERWLNNLYFYHADTPREPFEWVREALHEYAHVMMPRIGRYGDARQYELWLDGAIGELLLLELLRPTLAAAASESLPPWMQAL